MTQTTARSDPGTATPTTNTLGLTALTATVPIAWGTTYLVTTEFLHPATP